MSNELEIIQDSTLGTIYEPATLEMHKFDEMKELVQGFSDKYTGLAFTRSDKKGAEEVRSKLLEVRDKFEKERKIIKRAYNEPLSAYEAKIKELNSLIDVPLNQIRDGLKEIDEAEREERIDALDKLLEIKLADTSVSIERNASWLNKGMWSAKLKPSTKLNDEIDRAIADAVKDKEYREMQVKVLTEFCKGQDIDPGGWVSQLDHRNAMEVIDLINMDKERKARIAADQERRAAEHEAFLLKQKEELAAIEEVEIVEVSPIEEPEPIQEEEHVITNVIQVTGTIAQLNNLNEFLVTSGIHVELVAVPMDPEEPGQEQEYMEDDLPESEPPKPATDIQINGIKKEIERMAELAGIAYEKAEKGILTHLNIAKKLKDITNEEYGTMLDYINKTIPVYEKKAAEKKATEQAAHQDAQVEQVGMEMQYNIPEK